MKICINLHFVLNGFMEYVLKIIFFRFWFQIKFLYTYLFQRYVYSVLSCWVMEVYITSLTKVTVCKIKFIFYIQKKKINFVFKSLGISNLSKAILFKYNVY